MPNSGQPAIAAGAQRPLLLAGAPLTERLLGPVGVGELAQRLGQLVEHLRDSHAAHALEHETELTDRFVESAPRVPAARFG